MAGNTNIVKAEVAGLYLNNARIAHITNVTITFNNELREVVGTSSVREYIYGRDSWSVTSEGFVSFQDGYNWDYIMELLDQYQTLTIKIPTNESGSDYLQGSILLESNVLTTGNSGEMIKMSLSFKGSSALQRVFTTYKLKAITNQSTVDGAGCATAYPTDIYLSNQAAYPYINVGDTIYTDSTTTSPLTGQANKYIGLVNRYGIAYRIDGSGVVISEHISTCGNSSGF
jgi:hypothetical protein